MDLFLEEQLDRALEEVAHRSMRHRLTRGRPFGLRSLEALALEVLLKEEQQKNFEITPSRLSTGMEVQSPVLSPVLTSLEKLGHISCRRDENDRRSRLISLTKQGREVAGRFAAEKKKKCSEMVAFLGEQDAREFARLLHRLTEYMDREAEKEEKGGD